MARQIFSTHSNRTHCFPLVIVPQLFKFFLNKTVVETNIVCNKDFVLRYLHNFSGYFIKFWGISDHFIVNAGQICDESGYITFRIYQCGKRIGYFEAVVHKDGNLGYFPFTA